MFCTIMEQLCTTALIQLQYCLVHTKMDGIQKLVRDHESSVLEVLKEKDKLEFTSSLRFDLNNNFVWIPVFRSIPLDLHKFFRQEGFCIRHKIWQNIQAGKDS